MSSQIFKMRMFLFMIFLSSCGFAQDGWQWTELAEMPEPVSNNAVTEGYCGDTLCVYSFTGIGSNLDPEAIHLKAWRYNSILNTWQQLPDVDDTMGKIAASASTVKNKIYIIGGYHVLPNFNEITSAKVHRFDPQTNQWLPNGTDAPIPVDDQVQVVWRDSLIYTVTGWSTSTNITDVQIYNPANDSWAAATPVPTSNSFRAFGASGVIVGDTIFYYGGTQISGINFVANNNIRRGVINPEDPTEIEWDLLPDTEFEDGYRTAAFSYGESAVWIGGASTAYNFDGLAYSNGSGVEPESVIRLFDTTNQSATIAQPTPYGVMDLRGIAVESGNSWIVAGGMEANQEVGSKVYRVEAPLLSIYELKSFSTTIHQEGSLIGLRFSQYLSAQLHVYDSVGKSIASDQINGNEFSISLINNATGIYFISILTESGENTVLKVWNP